eukprot:TRINITY_DN5201_c0_g1_i2.p1 TRINITY_DN5201_c0_g1~~TRINITY_DN5201_c0_g1_i2.p1  ORF type:complete len:290 (+),score=69.82 TRINITY_DN5201_c0_g1_i2:64-933(+)
MEFLSIVIIVILIIIIAALVNGSKKNSSHLKIKNENNLLYFPDRFKTLEELQIGLQKSGLESSNLILAIDFTASNSYQGKITFGGNSLHSLKTRGYNSNTILNPYQSVISILGKTLEPFDDDHIIPTYGFGDITTQDHSVFPLHPSQPLIGFESVLQQYEKVVPYLKFSGPTNFAPAIYKAIDIVKETRSYHILVLICDGEVICEKETTKSIVDASYYPLSIVCVGVGDGPFDQLEEYDDNLPSRKFDNFQFVNYNKVLGNFNSEVEFSRMCLQEIPDQYLAIRKLKLL